MTGKIKWYNPDNNIGFIVREDGGDDVFFHISSVSDSGTILRNGTPVEFDAVESRRKRGQLEARNIRYPSGYTPPKYRVEDSSKGWITAGQYIYKWGYIVLDDILQEDGNRTKGVLHDLRDMALNESWSFGLDQNDRIPFPILKSYIVYTFFRLYKEGKIMKSAHSGEEWAAFNTGLVNDLYDPIYAMFCRNNRPSPPWRFHSFCCANIDYSGRKLASLFDPPPAPPKNFNNPIDVIYDPDATLLPRYDHIIYDGVARNRFPKEFLEDNVPKGVEWIDPDSLNETDRVNYLNRFVDGI